jgi:predicted kinase
MPVIHLVEGPVGAGKSTYAAKLGAQHAAPRLILDDWMATLFRADRPEKEVMAWYMERKRRCIEQIWNVACDLVAAGSNVVLELGLIQRGDRAEFYSRVDAAGYQLKVHVLDAPREVRRQRVRERNAAKGSTFFMPVPDEIFELASDLWQIPDETECAEQNIYLVSTHNK